ncbi:hypothetical protein H5410_054287, partial [Solanum commersonii]
NYFKRYGHSVGGKLNIFLKKNDNIKTLTQLSLLSHPDPPPPIPDRRHATIPDRRCLSNSSRSRRFHSSFLSWRHYPRPSYSRVQSHHISAMPHRARPMAGLLLFTGLNVVLVSTITPVYDFVCFHPYWERRREHRHQEREAALRSSTSAQV